MNAGLGERFQRLARDFESLLEEETRTLRRGDVAALDALQGRKEPLVRTLELLSGNGTAAEEAAMRHLHELQRHNALLLREAIAANRRQHAALQRGRSRLRHVHTRYRRRPGPAHQLRASA